MEDPKRDRTWENLDRGQAALRRRAFGRASYVAGDDTLILVGGKTLIRGQPRFKPLKTKRRSSRHCKSCGSFRRSGACKQDPDIFTVADGDACSIYWNRTYDHETRNALSNPA